MLFGDLPRLNAARAATKIALIDGDVALTWSDVDKLTNRFSRFLREMGLKKGERIAWISGNRYEWVIAVYGAARFGAPLVPLPAHSTSDELQRTFDEAEIRLVIAEESAAERIDAAAAASVHRPQRIVLGRARGGWLPFSARMNAQSDQRFPSDVTMDDELIVLYSSGSTGRPKGIVLTHRHAIVLALSNVIGLKVSADDVGVIFIPNFHKGAFNVNKLHGMMGGTVVMLPKFDARAMLSAIQQHRVTNIVGFPSTLQDMAAQPDFREFDLSSLRRILVTGTVMTEQGFRQTKEAFPNAEILHAYGLTDAGGLVTVYSDHDRSDKLGSVGKAMPNAEIEIHDENGQPLPSPEIGEIVIRADSLMKGYLKQPELTRETLRGGWLHTGDLGLIDRDGYLWVKGRDKELIKTGGENVTPYEVENALAAHPAVLEAAVFGVPDNRWGEAVVAAVALRPNTAATERELIDFCGTRLAAFKRPKQVHFFDQLPKNALSAKILRDQLRATVIARKQPT